MNNSKGLDKREQAAIDKRDIDETLKEIESGIMEGEE